MQTKANAPTHYRFIDCLRGYAVLLVISAHATYEVAGLPFPIKRIITNGWFGVQLFFIASAVTLLMSWHSERRKTGQVAIWQFFIRRFFRIAPAYYAASLLYFFYSPPIGGFDPWQAMRAAFFVNGWHPAWMSTTGGWIVVPGGWSIAVEFSFYAAFPLMAVLIDNLRRAWSAVIAALGLGVVMNLAAWAWMQPMFGDVATGNFLFFWFPNQVSVFAAGFVLYFLLRDSQASVAPLRLAINRHANTVACLAVLIFAGLAFIPQGHYLGDWPLMPAGQMICIPLMLFVLALSSGPTAFVNRPMAALGKVSFSAYLVHFAVLKAVAEFPEIFYTGATGYSAVVAFGALLAVTVIATFVVASVTYRVIEKPMIDLARRIQGHLGTRSTA